MGDEHPLIECSSPNYFVARDKFRQLADALGWQREAHAIAARGPAGEELTIDVAWSSAPSEAPTLVVSSGLHGVEAEFGSAVQLSLLAAIARKQWNPTNVRLVMLHALNPFGYVHSRRFDADNIDNNRNFLLPGEEFRGSPAGYEQLDKWLNPRSPTHRFDWFLPQAVYHAVRMGTVPLKQAIAGGQFDFEKGLFFGGDGPSQTHLVLSKHFARWMGESSKIVHLDFHTGLGKWGTGKLLLDAPLAESQRTFLDTHIGPNAYEETHAVGVAYQVRGSLGCWCARQGAAADYLYACAEFGTYSPLQALQGLRAENRAHHWGEPQSAATQRAKERLRELFCPASPAWRKQVVGTAVEWIEGAIAGLNKL
ncbi:M14 family metallopeptidase [Anatilimnocola sp. NA78]|uniref:M14 family metallopeptidase n=1 Tax=Anatilimnocola sp. NA78 TaxID=3415683 RepID=UPI003CE45C99